MTGNTAFPLGLYVGNPNGNDPAAEAQFESDFNAFVQTMGGARPAYMDGFTDFSQDPSQWAANASWTAWSWAMSGSAYVGPGSGVTPVVGVPLASSAGGWGNVDTFYQQIVAGQYDADYKGIVDAWAGQGYNTIQLRLAYEFDGNFMPWAPGNSGSASANADFIAAWQHVANLVHAEGRADGITVQTVWNPADINWATTAPAALYPGDQYVDIISADAYSPTYPNDLTDWSTGGASQLASQAAWAAIAANREHFWQYSDASQWNPTGSGAGWSFQDTVDFARAHNKPISLSETGAGGNGTTTGPVDDAAFPQWLAGALAAAEAEGVKVQNVNVWATDQSDGSWGFLNGEKPGEAAAWDKYFGAGSGSGTGGGTGTGGDTGGAPGPLPAQAMIGVTADGATTSIVLSSDTDMHPWAIATKTYPIEVAINGHDYDVVGVGPGSTLLFRDPVPAADAQWGATVTPLARSVFVLQPGTATSMVLDYATRQIGFVGGGALNVRTTGGKDTLVMQGANNSFTAGQGSLDVRGGPGHDTYIFGVRSGTLTIEDFSAGKGDALVIAKSLQATTTLTQVNGGERITFGAADPNGSILLKGAGASGFSASLIHWQ